MKLNILNKLPPDFSQWKVEELHAHLGGPTLINLSGKKRNPIFISTLLHGNEHSGFLALQAFFKDLFKKSMTLPRDLILFIGNTESAKMNLRHLEGKSDFNRVWDKPACELGKVAQEVIDFIRPKEPFCSIDLHNNTGTNPFYTCINILDTSFLSLAKLFSDPIVYFTEPHEVQSMAFSKFCPSITIEMGQSGEACGIDHFLDRFNKLLSLEFLPTPIESENLTVFESMARMKFKKETSLDFDFSATSQKDFSFQRDIDHHNFKEVKIGEVLAYWKKPTKLFIEGQKGDDLVHDFFDFQEKKLIVKRPFIPAMLTKDIPIIKDDCFGYIMKPVKVR